MTDPISSTLQSMAESFSIQKSFGGSHFFGIQLINAFAQDDRLVLLENVVETVIEKVPVDLSWLTKEVRFTKPDIADANLAGGQPIPNLLTPAIVDGSAAPPGVPGTLTALQGMIPIPIQKTVTKPLDIAIDLKWEVVDEKGSTATDVQWFNGLIFATESGFGGNIPVQLGQTALSLVLLFAPTIVELVPGLPLTSKRTVKASVRLTARDAAGFVRATTGWVTLPPIDIHLPVIAVPTVALFFTDPDFKQNILIAVPSTSPLEEGTLKPALDQLNSLLGTITSTVAIGSFFVSQLGTIAAALANASMIAFRKTDSFAKLADIPFEGWDWEDPFGGDANDAISSMMLIGPPNRAIDCFNDRDFSTYEGQMRVAVGQGLLTKVNSLVMANPNVIPASDPPGMVTVPFKPKGINFWKTHTTHEFDDEFSSYRFTWV